MLDAVVFSGGEPTLQRGLAAAMLEVRALGFLVGLHTAGIVPRHLERLLPLVDWVGMDLKAPFDEYESITGFAWSGRRASESMRLILASGVACEFRTTVARGEERSPSVARVAALAAARGAPRYVLQEMRVMDG